MNDMSSVIVPKSDQINADDLIGGSMTIRIRDIAIKGGQEQPVSIFFDGSDKAYRPCKSMSRVLVAAWGPDANVYRGRSLTLYRDPTVKWGGMEVGGIRISHMSDIEAPMTLALTATKGSRKPFIVKPLTTDRPAAGITLDQARAKLNDAADLDELRTIWANKVMAPHRDTLGPLLEQLKASLGAPDPQPNPNEGAGELFTFDADQIIGFIAAKTRVQDVESLVESHRDTIAGFDSEDVERIEDAKARRIEAIKGGQV